MDNLNTQEVKKKKKSFIPVIIAAGIGIFAVVFAVIIIVAVVASPKVRAQKQLNLGEKFISDLDYENAVLAYQEAIQIDPKNKDAYIGLANAYMNLADQFLAEGDSEKALKYLKRAIKEVEAGVDNTDSEEIEDIIDEMEDRKEEIEDNKNEPIIEDEPEEESEKIRKEENDSEANPEPEFHTVALNEVPEGLQDFLSLAMWVSPYDCEDDNSVVSWMESVLEGYNGFEERKYQKYCKPCIEVPLDDYPYYEYYYDVEGYDWIMKNIYNASDSQLQLMHNRLPNSEGRYIGHTAGIGGPEEYSKIQKIETDGQICHVQFEMGYVDQPGYEIIKYAVVEHKTIDNQGYWTLRKLDDEPMFQFSE